MVTYPWIDWLKAFGIVLVLIGHTQIPIHLLKWIYSFHMPLFFLCSGFLLGPKTFSDPFGTFVQKRLRKLALAFYFFGLIGSLHLGLILCFGHLSYADEGAGATVHPILWRIASLLYASGTVDGRLGLIPTALWFFPALITGLIFTYLCMRWVPVKAAPWALGLLSVLGYFGRSMALPWEIESGMIAAGLIALGFGIRGSDRTQERLKGMNPLLASLSLLIGSACAFWNTPTDFRSSAFGNPLIACCACVLILAPIASLSMRLPESLLIRRLSESTLLVFPLHPIVFNFLDAFMTRFAQMPREWVNHSPLWIILKTAITLAVLSLSYPLFCRVLPALGRREPKVNDSTQFRTAQLEVVSQGWVMKLLSAWRRR